MPKPQGAGMACRAGWHAQASRRGHGVPAKRGHHTYPIRTSEEEPRTSSPCGPLHTHALRKQGGMPKPQGAGMACRRREDIIPTRSGPRKESHGLPVRAAVLCPTPFPASVVHASLGAGMPIQARRRHIPPDGACFSHTSEMGVFSIRCSRRMVIFSVPLKFRRCLGMKCSSIWYHP